MQNRSILVLNVGYSVLDFRVRCTYNLLLHQLFCSFWIVAKLFKLLFRSVPFVKSQKPLKFIPHRVLEITSCLLRLLDQSFKFNSESLVHCIFGACLWLFREPGFCIVKIRLHHLELLLNLLLAHSVHLNKFVHLFRQSYTFRPQLRFSCSFFYAPTIGSRII